MTSSPQRLPGLLPQAAPPGSTPGLGVEVGQDAAAAFPYRPAYLPVNGLTDGTVHDW
ncbi:MAG: hypothetical protein ACXVYU_03540 [Oryzihumus sp.]